MNAENIKNTIQAIIDGLTPLAQKLQIPIEGLFRWAIKHNYAIAVEELVGSVICMVAMFVGYKFVKLGFKKDAEQKEMLKSVNEGDRWKYSSTDNFGFYMAGGMIIVVSLVLLTFILPMAIDRLIAPEWNTAQDIMCLIKGGCGGGSN
jgi:hypothetical protein